MLVAMPALCHRTVAGSCTHTQPFFSSQMAHHAGSAALAALLALVAACGACDGLASGALYGEAAVLAPRYTQALATGNSLSGGQQQAGGMRARLAMQAMMVALYDAQLLPFSSALVPTLPPAGIAVSLLRLATKATLPDTPAGLRRSAQLYFSIAALACAACLLLYSLVLPRLGAVRRRRGAALAAAMLSYGPLADGPPGTGGEQAAGPAEDSERKGPPQVAADDGWRQQQQAGLDLELSAEDRGSAGLAQQQQGEAAPLLVGQQHGMHSGGSGGRAGLALLRRLWRLALANALVFV